MDTSPSSVKRLPDFVCVVDSMTTFWPAVLGSGVAMGKREVDGSSGSVASAERFTTAGVEVVTSCAQMAGACSQPSVIHKEIQVEMQAAGSNVRIVFLAFAGRFGDIFWATV